MVMLLDFDSIIYKSVYKVVSIKEMREALSLYGKAEAKEWLLREVYDYGINRCENEILSIQNHLQSIFLNEITGVELFITTCSKSFRKELSKEYKSKRKKNNYVWTIREHYKFNDAKFSDTLEADDLIAIRSKELGKDNCIVVSIDKDLRQIGGYYWSYYKMAEKDNYGNFCLTEEGYKNMVYKHNSVDYISEEEASLFFWKQMLMGDSGDGISGIKAISVIEKFKILQQTGYNIACKVGEVTAKKILKDSNNHFITVAREYIKRNQKDDFWINYKLLKLG
jgi:5'-3' exonuclease